MRRDLAFLAFFRLSGPAAAAADTVPGADTGAQVLVDLTWAGGSTPEPLRSEGAGLRALAGAAAAFDIKQPGGGLSSLG